MAKSFNYNVVGKAGRLVMVNVQETAAGRRVTARLYVGGADPVATPQTWKGKTTGGADRWAMKVLRPVAAGQ